jgi:hypothetical protein
MSASETSYYVKLSPRGPKALASSRKRASFMSRALVRGASVVPKYGWNTPHREKSVAPPRLEDPAPTTSDAEKVAQGIYRGSEDAVEILLQAIRQRSPESYGPILLVLRILWTKYGESVAVAEAIVRAIQVIGQIAGAERDSLAVGGTITLLALNAPARLTMNIRLLFPDLKTSTQVLEAMLSLRSAFLLR